MKLKSFSLVTLAIGIVLSILGLVSPFIALQNYTVDNGAVGTIGGMGTPTYQYVASQLMNGLPFCLILFGISFVVTALFCLIFPTTVKEHCSLKTTAMSIALSAAGAMGLVCVFTWISIVAFDEMSKHPIAYPVSIVLGIVCLLAFIALAVLYFKSRKNFWSVKGFVIDVFSVIIYLPSSFFAFSSLYEILSR